MTWRLLDTGALSAAENMAFDEALLSARDEGHGPDTLRFLEWSQPCVLVGFNQAVSLEVREAYCRERGIAINRRITGGGAILCDGGQLGWELIARKDLPGFPRRPGELYSLLCEGAVRGLRRLGVEATFRPRNDIEVNGRKISGTGGTEKREAFLFQGTLLVDFDVETMVRALRVPAEKLRGREIDSIRERVTWLGRELGRVPDRGELKRAIAAGVGEVLGVGFHVAGPSDREQCRVRELLARFASEEWVYATRRPSLHRLELRAIHRSPGGLIRVSLMADARARRIRQVLITGDFFTYPTRALPDLEAALKDASFAGDDLRENVRRFFVDRSVTVPGCGPEHFCVALEKALGRLALLDRGLTVEEANALHVVVTPWLEHGGELVVLLPYCAKLPACEWRNRDGCARCGLCSVGEAYEIADAAGCRAVSVNDYEELRAVLEQERQAGTAGFVGCCCQAFYAKHADDFEEVGLPGVLIEVDSTTCYDLGLLKEAKAGEFRQQTELKTELLRKVLGLVLGVPRGGEAATCPTRPSEEAA
ncbi:MAG: DUF116 domain-containing protein [Deltaproteobacteria bacterium]|nr:DUF116 domain-containing protein [Deltaproteobacteria bacterium]